MLCGIKGLRHDPILWRRRRLSSHFVFWTVSQKNGLSDLIQIWHVDVTGPEAVLYSFVTLNSH